MNKLNEILNLQRKFQSLAVILFAFDYQRAVKSLVEVTAKFGGQIRSLTIHETEFIVAKHFLMS